MAKEYYKMPEKTDKEFFNDNGRRWFKTDGTALGLGSGLRRPDFRLWLDNSIKFAKCKNYSLTLTAESSW